MSGLTLECDHAVLHRSSTDVELHPLPEVILGGLLAWPLDRAGDVLRFYRDFAPTLPDQAELFAALVTAPTGVPVVALLPGYNGPFDEGQQVFAPLAALGEPALYMVGPMPYGVRQALLDEPNAIHGLQRYWVSGFATEMPDALIDAAAAAAGSFTSPMSAVLFLYIHGAATRVDPGGYRLRASSATVGCEHRRSVGTAL